MTTAHDALCILLNCLTYVECRGEVDVICQSRRNNFSFGERKLLGLQQKALFFFAGRRKMAGLFNTFAIAIVIASYKFMSVHVTAFQDKKSELRKIGSILFFFSSTNKSLMNLFFFPWEILGAKHAQPFFFHFEMVLMTCTSLSFEITRLKIE